MKLKSLSVELGPPGKAIIKLEIKKIFGEIIEKTYLRDGIYWWCVDDHKRCSYQNRVHNYLESVYDTAKLKEGYSRYSFLKIVHNDKTEALESLTVEAELLSEELKQKMFKSVDTYRNKLNYELSQEERDRLLTFLEKVQQI